MKNLTVLLLLTIALFGCSKEPIEVENNPIEETEENYFLNNLPCNEYIFEETGDPDENGNSDYDYARLNFFSDSSFGTFYFHWVIFNEDGSATSQTVLVDIKYTYNAETKILKWGELDFPMTQTYELIDDNIVKILYSSGEYGQVYLHNCD